MKHIIYEELNTYNFNERSLDHFIRHQIVKECWRTVDGKLQLVKDEFTEHWTFEECREIAKRINSNLGGTMYDFGAFYENELIGYITIGKTFFGSQNQYIELVEFEVSEPYRNQGIGRKLFEMACERAKSVGAKKLYISAHSSKESQAAYRKLGCMLADEINPINVEKEPCDVQMEYCL